MNTHAINPNATMRFFDYMLITILGLVIHIIGRACMIIQMNREAPLDLLWVLHIYSDVKTCNGDKHYLRGDETIRDLI